MIDDIEKVKDVVSNLKIEETAPETKIKKPRKSKRKEAKNDVDEPETAGNESVGEIDAENANETKETTNSKEENGSKQKRQKVTKLGEWHRGRR